MSNTSERRYVIIGAGAVGVTLAAELSGSGRPVLLVGRGRQLEALRARELRFITPAGSRVLDVPVADADEVRLQPGDVLVLATKAQQAEAALARWAGTPVAGSDKNAGAILPVVTLQNGLDTERAALRRFATVIGSVLWVPSTYTRDGEVVSPAAPAHGVFWLGRYPDGPPSPVAARIAADLTRAGFEVQLVDDLSRWKAAKLIVASAFVLDALYRPGPERDRAARLVQAEARAILAAAGADPADVTAETTAGLDRFVVRDVPGHERPGSSSFQSLVRGRDLETDYLNGEIVLLARELGRRAPIAQALADRARHAARAGVDAGSLDSDDLARTLASTVLVDSTTLAAELAGSRPPRLLDVRWALGDADGEKHYLEGHLRGAVYVDLDTELAAPATGSAGRHPLPEVADLQRAAHGWGLNAGDPIVVYDASGGQSAARAWWLLRWAGLTDVRLLDGGLVAWVGSGGQVEIGGYRPDPGTVELTGGHLPVLDADEAAALPEHGLLLDARAGERYRGEVEPIDSRAGHIPGAVSLPTGGNLLPDGRFHSVAHLRERFAGVGVTAGGPVGIYCGSGVTAAHQIAALAVAGLDGALYPGSWSAWSADSGRPVATGYGPS